MTPKEEKLEVCPFCSTRAGLVMRLDEQDDDGAPIFVVGCTECGALGPHSVDAEEATAQWGCTNVDNERLVEDLFQRIEDGDLDLFKALAQGLRKRTI